MGVPCREDFSRLIGSSILGVIRVSSCEGDLAMWAFYQRVPLGLTGISYGGF